MYRMRDSVRASCLAGNDAAWVGCFDSNNSNKSQPTTNLWSFVTLTTHHKAASKFVDEFTLLVAVENLAPEQVHNADKSALYWCHMFTQSIPLEVKFCFPAFSVVQQWPGPKVAEVKRFNLYFINLNYVQAHQLLSNGPPQNVTLYSQGELVPYK